MAAEESFKLGTPDRDVRPQIEAVKSYFSTEGFSEVTDPAHVQDPFSGRHIVWMSFAGERRIARLSYAWLADHPSDAANWLDGKQDGPQLKDAEEVIISDSGLINYKGI